MDDELRSAAYALYMMGRWELPADKAPASQQAEAWERLREALGLKPGHATNAGVHS